MTSVVKPSARDQLPEAGLFVAGGTWVFSEPQLTHTVLVDLNGLGWPSITVHPEGLDVAATATIDELGNYRYPETWLAAGLFEEAARCLLASFKVLAVATIGGNIALALPAGSMIAVAVTLDATVLVWRADGSSDRVPARDFVAGTGSTALGAGDLIRSLHFPLDALTSRTAVRRAAMADRGRTGALVIGRTRADGSEHLVVTGATDRPVVLGRGTAWSAAGASIDPDLYVNDAHGSAEWRRAMVDLLASEVAAELGWRA